MMTEESVYSESTFMKITQFMDYCECRWSTSSRRSWYLLSNNKGNIELNRSTTWSIVVEFPVKKAEHLPSLTAD